MFHKSSINLSNETEPWRADLNSKFKHAELIEDNEVYSIFFPIDSTREASLPDAFEITFWKKNQPNPQTDVPEHMLLWFFIEAIDFPQLNWHFFHAFSDYIVPEI